MLVNGRKHYEKWLQSHGRAVMKIPRPEALWHFPEPKRGTHRWNRKNTVGRK